MNRLLGGFLIGVVLTTLIYAGMGIIDEMRNPIPSAHTHIWNNWHYARRVDTPQSICPIYLGPVPKETRGAVLLQWCDRCGTMREVPPDSAMGYTWKEFPHVPGCPREGERYSMAIPLPGLPPGAQSSH